jgi:hypothetical protein
LVYVDDTIVASSSAFAVSALLGALQKDFALKIWVPCTIFWGIEVQQINDGLRLSQKKYTLDLLHCAGMLNCKHVSTPWHLAQRFRQMMASSWAKKIRQNIRALLVHFNT